MKCFWCETSLYCDFGEVTQPLHLIDGALYDLWPSENNQQLFEKSYKKLFKDFKYGTEILVGLSVFKLQIKTVKMLFMDQ